MEIVRVELPVEEAVADRWIAFWQAAFGTSFEHHRRTLTTGDRGINRDCVYEAREAGVLAGTCRVTQPVARPDLGGMGEVAVSESWRGRGLASVLCRRARDEFVSAGGRLLFLATVNPAAFRVYHRLGWKRMPGSTVMAYAQGPLSPEEAVRDLVSAPVPWRVGEGDAADRIPLIPLCVHPHDAHVLDATAGLYSVRYVSQRSCMGLYPKVEGVREGRRGNWFSARTDAGMTVGLATARVGDDGVVAVDAFAVPAHADAAPVLLRRAVAWAAARGTARVQAVLSPLDSAKKALFEGEGFAAAGRRGSFDLGLGDARVEGVLFELAGAVAPGLCGEEVWRV